MPYRQYTQCVAPNRYSGPPIWNAIAAGFFAALMEIVIFVLATGGLALIAGGVAAMLALVTGLLSYVRYWLYGRLICLGGEHCTIGLVISVERPQDKWGPPDLPWYLLPLTVLLTFLPFGRLDSDYSFNLLLADHPIGADQATIESGSQGNLIRAQPGTLGIALPTPGQPARACDSDPWSAVLHCEFEGAGMYIFYLWLKGLLVILIVAGVASFFCAVPVIGWIVCAIAAILLGLALVGLLLGFLDGLSDAASPSDVDPTLGGELHWGCRGADADVLLVSGEWVYDSAHEGWNEIHPVRHCQSVGRWVGNWGQIRSGTIVQTFDWEIARHDWCAAVGSVSSPLTVDNQKRPENQWTIHPLVDGCQPHGRDWDFPRV